MASHFCSTSCLGSHAPRGSASGTCGRRRRKVSTTTGFASPDPAQRRATRSSAPPERPVRCWFYAARRTLGVGGSPRADCRWRAGVHSVDRHRRVRERRQVPRPPRRPIAPRSSHPHARTRTCTPKHAHIASSDKHMLEHTGRPGPAQPDVTDEMRLVCAEPQCTTTAYLLCRR